MPIETDALIIGAGPVGLFQAFQLGLQDLRAHIVDALPYAGGQCIELYADKPIYDIPGTPLCTGRELVAQLQKQVAPFAPQYHFSQTVNTLEHLSNKQFFVRTSAAIAGAPPAVTEFLTKTIFIAAGAGAFQARTLKLEGAAALEGRQIHYTVQPSGRFAGNHVVINGDGDTALSAALALAQDNLSLDRAHKMHITVVHRRDVFSAALGIVERFRSLLAGGALHFVAGQVVGLRAVNQALESLDVLQSDGSVHPLRCDHLLVLQGLSPKLGPIADWGLAMERRQLNVDTESFSTEIPGIFAVGDINTYPGKRKLIACGFHETILAAFGATAIIRPGEKILLQYTTTSSRLHRLLGVEHPTAG